MLYRGLLGPYDQNKSDDAGLLGSQHELTKWRMKSFFRERVSDGASDASVELDVSFGGDLLTVRRALSDLHVEYLALNGEELSADLATFNKTVVQLSGAASHFDFFAILRYLVFYLEDHVALIWDKRSQFDMMRVLLFDRSAAKSAAKEYDEVQTADSQFRNRRAIVNKDRERLAELERNAGRAEAAEYRVLQIALAAANAKDLEQSDLIEQTSHEIAGARLQREKSLLDLQEARTAVEFEEQAHYEHLFPSMEEAAKYVFLNLLGGGGCLVCGNISSDAADYLRSKLDEHHCPICDSTEEQQEKVISSRQFSRARFEKAKLKVERLRDAVSFATARIEALDLQYQELVDRRSRDQDERQACHSACNIDPLSRGIGVQEWL
jgi:rubrerythrin